MKPRQFSQYVQRCKRMKYYGGQEGNINCLSGWDSRKRAGWGLAGSWSLFQRSSSHCSLFQGELVSKPPGRTGIFFKKSNQTYFFWAGHLVIQIQKEWDWSPEMFTFWNTFQVPIQDDSWAQAFAFFLLFLPKPRWNYQMKDQATYPQQGRE